MIDPDLTLKADRSLLPGAPAPLELHGRTGSGLYVVTAWSPPALISHTTYAPPNPFVDGQEPVGTAWETALASFTYFADVDTETDAKAARADLVAAISQFAWDLTSIESDAPGEVWHCERGSIRLENDEGRTFADMANTHPHYRVTIPCYPIPGEVAP